MSDEDQSGDNRSFLARWSQRKHEAKQPDRDAPSVDADVPAVPVAEGDAAQEFDLSSLPKLEDLTATTDITAFLRKGVPESLRNAALKKFWALDPAIRDYVNPALEYAYDWNTPGGVPGNSELGPRVDVGRLVSQIMGGGEAVVEPAVSAVDLGNESASARAQADEPGASQESGPGLPAQALRLTEQGISAAQRPASGDESAGVMAGQAKNSDEDSVAPQQRVRRHGSAKPLI